MTRPYILYSIRTNIFRQAMKKKDLLTLWAEAKHFLKTFTTAEITNPRSITLKIYPIFDRKKLDKNLEEIITVSERPNLEPIWNLKNEDLEKAILGLHNVQKHMPVQPNAIELQIWYNFRFLNLTDSFELANQETQSYINFIFSKRHSCGPCLIFPFSEPVLEFWTYIDNIKPMLPFDLDEKLLRKVYVKNGQPSAAKKIARQG